MSESRIRVRFGPNESRKAIRSSLLAAVCGPLRPAVLCDEGSLRQPKALFELSFEEPGHRRERFLDAGNVFGARLGELRPSAAAAAR
jgi:hypothetical protein